MENEQQEFLLEIEQEIKKRTHLQNFYSGLRLFLMVTIAVCGFLTAAGGGEISQFKWLSSPWTLFLLGFISFVCAVFNQYMTPSAMKVFHQNIRKAMEFIKGEVKYSRLKLADANKLKSIAIIEPEIVLGKLKEMFEDGN